MRNSLWLVLVCWLPATLLPAQDSQWWSENVGWDGSRPYQYYLQLNAAGMGPHALPVPAMPDWNGDDRSWLMSRVLLHRHKEETTVAAQLGLQWRAASWFRLDVRVIPLEHFRTRHALKTRRKIFYQAYDDQVAGGDFHIESHIRLPKAWLAGLDGALRIGLRAPSGTHLGAARHTDTPGYHFDLSVRHQWSDQHSLEAMLGFYVYQTYADRSRQNDCLLWGFSHRWQAGRWSAVHSLRGYAGYLGGGDAPVVVESTWGWQAGASWSWQLQAGGGLRDYPFLYGALGGRWHFLLPVTGPARHE